MAKTNPYQSPSTTNPPPATDANRRSTRSTLVLTALAIVIAFVVTPLASAFSWLQGYGSGGMHELRSGYPIRGMLLGSAFLSPIHLLAFALPKRKAFRRVGYAISVITISLMMLYWFVIAAVIASV